MTWSRRAAVAAALVVATVAPARAQVTGRPIEISAGAGMMAFDTRAYIKDAPTIGGTFGLRLTPWVTLEASGLMVQSESELVEGVDHNFGYAGLDVRWNLRPAEDRVVPYLVTGGGYSTSRSGARSPAESEGGAGNLGMGLLYNVGGPRTYLRLEVRDVILRDRTADLVSNFAVTAGFHVVLWGKYKDVDYDAVRDWLDNCPQTPIGAQVTPDGCPTDADRDSVFDGLDQCANTPPGCRVDDKGCPVDTDKDGVCDGLDQCADTPLGAAVNATGCPGDVDGDAILDGLDQCADTPKGATVDALGCPVDSDGDGVPDGIDNCANTQKSVAVDALGCPTVEGLRMVELMDTGTMRVQNLGFASGSANLSEAAKPTLDAVGAVLLKTPTLNYEIGGHSDNQGSADANRRLSEQRAKSVREYLVLRYPELKLERFKVRGYGSSKPIAPNTTEVGREANRRVEFTVTNKDELIRMIKEQQTPPKAPEEPEVPIEPR